MSQEEIERILEAWNRALEDSVEGSIQIRNSENIMEITSISISNSLSFLFFLLYLL